MEAPVCGSPVPAPGISQEPGEESTLADPQAGWGWDSAPHGRSLELAPLHPGLALTSPPCRMPVWGP